eukprot:g3225.t1
MAMAEKENKKVVGLAFLGRENNPFYIRYFGESEETIDFHYIVHASLDILDEKLSPNGRASVMSERFLGLLLPIEDFQVFGYATTLGMKIIIVTTGDVGDVFVSQICSKLHASYVEALSNPFLSVKETSGAASSTAEEKVSYKEMQLQKSKKFERDILKAIKF